MINKIIMIIREFWPQFLEGLKVTVLLALIGTIIGLIIALIFSALRVVKINKNDKIHIKISKNIGLLFVKTYVTIFRGTPMIVQAVIFYYSFYQAGIKWSAFAAGLFTISLNTAAYLTEVLRGGIESVDKGQTEAARSIGLSSSKTFLYIIFPQALKNSFASIGNELIVNIKDSAVLSVISVIDVFSVADSAAGKYFLFIEAMLVAAGIYLVLTYSTAKILQLIERKLGVETKEMVSSN